MGHMESVILAELRTLRAEQEAFFAATIAATLAAAGKKVEDIPEAVVTIMKKSRVMADNNLNGRF